MLRGQEFRLVAQVPFPEATGRVSGFRTSAIVVSFGFRPWGSFGKRTTKFGCLGAAIALEATAAASSNAENPVIELSSVAFLPTIVQSKRVVNAQKAQFWREQSFGARPAEYRTTTTIPAGAVGFLISV